MNHQPLIDYSPFLPRSHSASTDRMVFATEAIPHESLHVILTELVKPWLKGMTSILEMRRQWCRAGNLLDMQHGLRDDEQVEGVREVVRIDGRVDGRICRYGVHAPAREWVFEDGEHGEVVAGIEDRVRAEEETGVVGVLRCRTGWKVDFLQACFFGVEELLDDERVFLCFT